MFEGNESKIQNLRSKMERLALLSVVQQNNRKEIIMTEASRAARIRCREIMTSNVQTATREMSLSQVAVMMRDDDMGSIPVVEDGKLVGIVADRDIVVRSIADGKNADSPVGDSMTTE